MPVAKSFQTLEHLSEPYTKNGKMYIDVKGKNGSTRTVRWYSDNEYLRMYPGEKIEEKSSSSFGTQHDLLGFQKGYITIFKGDTYKNIDWFRQSIARYTRFWGWYIVSEEEIPEDLPSDVVAVRLPWESVGQDNGILKSESEIKDAIDALLYEESPSEFQGEIGERLELTLTVMRTVDLENNYGHSIMHIMEDENENVYVWTTSSKSWTPGSVKHLRGTVKNHNIYRNVKQTILSRCMEVK